MSRRYTECVLQHLSYLPASHVGVWDPMTPKDLRLGTRYVHDPKLLYLGFPVKVVIASSF